MGKSKCENELERVSAEKEHWHALARQRDDQLRTAMARIAQLQSGLAAQNDDAALLSGEDGLLANLRRQRETYRSKLNALTDIVGTFGLGSLRMYETEKAAFQATRMQYIERVETAVNPAIPEILLTAADEVIQRLNEEYQQIVAVDEGDDRYKQTGLTLAALHLESLAVTRVAHTILLGGSENIVNKSMIAEMLINQLHNTGEIAISFLDGLGGKEALGHSPRVAKRQIENYWKWFLTGETRSDYTDDQALDKDIQRGETLYRLIETMSKDRAQRILTAGEI